MAKYGTMSPCRLNWLPSTKGCSRDPVANHKNRLETHVYLTCFILKVPGPPIVDLSFVLHVFKKMIGIPCFFNDSKNVKADVSDIFLGPAQVY